ncbi:hypothetical protein GMSM_22700 [Geomonas sp. Red276]
MSRFTKLPIRIQLLVIAILLTLPALGIIVYSGLRARHESYRNAEIETQKLADNIAARQESLITEAQLLGSLLADLPEVNRRNKEKVEPLIVRIHKKNPQYTSILISDETGRIWASSIPGMDDVSIADRRYFKSARATMRFSSGEYALHRVLNTPTISFAYPLTRQGNGFSGTVILSYDLDIMRSILRRSRLPRDTNYVLVDHRGLTLSRGVETVRPLGTPVSPPAWKALSQGGGRGTGVLLRNDGQLRISSWRTLRLAGEPTPYLYVIAGMSLKAAVENENRKLAYSIAMLLPFAGCAFLLAVIIGNRSITEPVARLRVASQQLVGGNLGTRVGPLLDGGEFGELGRVFDEMTSRLQVTLQRLQLATSSGHLGVWDWNIREETMVWDDRMLELYGIPREEFTGSVYTWIIGLHPDDKERAMADCAAALEGEGDFDSEFRVVAPDGTVRHLKADGIVIRDGDGSAVRMIGINRDITDQKRMEEALKHRLVALTSPPGSTSDIKFEDLFDLDEIQRIQDAFAEAMGVASLITDVEGAPITRPSNFCHLCEHVIRGTTKGLANCYRSAAAIGKTHHGPAIQHCLSGGLWDGGASIRVGERQIAIWLVGQVLDDSCDPESMMAYAREIGADEDEYREALSRVNRMSLEQFQKVSDALFLIASQLSRQALQNVQQAKHITERKQAEEERLCLERQLMHAQKMESLGVLAGGIAHDFNNILTAIVGNTELALMRLKPDSPLREFLERVSQSAMRAADLAKQMLAYSGKGMFVVEPIDLNKVVEEQERVFLSSLPAKVELRLELARPLPLMKGDAAQIRQLIMNLVVNGSEAIGDATGSIVIRTSSRWCEREELKGAWVSEEMAAGSYVVLEVADTGCGMDEETRAKIFEPFFTTKFTGRGLGMSAVQGIVRGHEGVVQIESEPGRGSVFRVLFPATA